MEDWEREIQKRLKAKNIEITIETIRLAIQEEIVRGSTTPEEVMSVKVVIDLLIRYLGREI